MSSISKRKKECSRAKIKSMGDHKEFLQRISKTLYYGQLPSLPCLSLPVTEISCAAWSAVQRGRSVRRLHADAAAGIARSACVSPCALVLAMLYMERLRGTRPDYLAATPPADLFLVSLMVSNKYLQDDGEDAEVLCSEWAEAGGMELRALNKLEVEFLSAMDWNIYVSKSSFDVGLSRLEGRVALREAGARGFFTYTDLCAACDSALLADVAAAVALAAVASLAALLALVTSTLVISHACMSPAPAPAPAPTPAPAPAHYLPNVTAPLPSDRLSCCSPWLLHLDMYETHERSVSEDWRTLEEWWSRTSVLNWLSQSSLVNPLQRWLQRIKEYVDLLRELESPAGEHASCAGRGARCMRQWLNLSKLSALVVSVADR